MTFDDEYVLAEMSMRLQTTMTSAEEGEHCGVPR